VVYVISQSGKPLMPTERYGKVRRLLKDSKAKVIYRKPFTIQLLYQTTEIVQEITLGVDAGYLKIGLSAITKKQELFSAEVQLRKDIVELLKARRMYRRNKRNHLWYRKPRWSNRKKSKDWLAPSIQHKLDSHIKIIEKVKEILPISKIVVEVANFDIQKIKNPEINGVEYQNGEQKGFFNLREYILHRDNYTCQICKAKKDKPLEVHHLGFWKNDRTNRPSNLITLCTDCHTPENHKQGGLLYGWKPKLKSFKPETFMSIVRWRMINQLREINNIPIEHTFGFITKYNRIEQKLEKSHINDAFVIAYGFNQKRIKGFVVTQIRRNNRKLQENRKGFKPSIRRKKYQFQSEDLVKFDNKICKVKGIHSYGRYIVLNDKHGNKVIGKKIKSIKTQNVKILKYQKGFAFGI